MWITNFKNYKLFLKRTLSNFPKNGRGQARRLAEHLGVAPVVVSQILTGERHFTVDQAIKIAEYLMLDENSKEYFVYLVCQARADTPASRDFYGKRIEALQEEARKIRGLVAARNELTDADKAVYYSNWYYSAVRILISIPGYQNVDAIADYYGLSREKVGQIVNFLVSCGLCSNEEGLLKVGKVSTYVGEGSEFLNNHRRNWREKARERFFHSGKDDIFYSSPMSISKADAETFRTEILELIKSFSKRVAASPEEKVMCINIDWFNF